MNAPIKIDEIRVSSFEVFQIDKKILNNLAIWDHEKIFELIKSLVNSVKFALEVLSYLNKDYLDLYLQNEEDDELDQFVTHSLGLAFQDD